jgi:inosose dehydratase
MAVQAPTQRKRMTRPEVESGALPFMQFRGAGRIVRRLRIAPACNRMPPGGERGTCAMMIKLGIGPLGWSNDDLPELGGDIPLEQCLAEASLVGYTGVEKGGKFPLDAAVLGPILERYGLKLVSGWFSGELRNGSVESEKRRILKQLELYQAMGCPVMVYAETTGSVQGRIETPVAERPRMAHEEFKRYGEQLTRLADWLKAEGCPMAFHHHMGTVVESEQEIDWLMANTADSVGLLFDTGHLVFAGGRIPDTIRRHGQRINHVHVKDIRRDVLAWLRAERWSFLKGVLEGVFTVPGDGMIDFDQVARLLKEIGYAGWVVVEAEQDPAKANPLEMARLGRRTISAAAKRAGLAVSA